MELFKHKPEAIKNGLLEVASAFALLKRVVCSERKAITNLFAHIMIQRKNCKV